MAGRAKQGAAKEKALVDSYRALEVIVLSRSTSAWLREHDPKALQQACEAIKSIERAWYGPAVHEGAARSEAQPQPQPEAKAKPRDADILVRDADDESKALLWLDDGERYLVDAHGKRRPVVETLVDEVAQWLWDHDLNPDQVGLRDDLIDEGIVDAYHAASERWHDGLRSRGEE